MSAVIPRSPRQSQRQGAASERSRFRRIIWAAGFTGLAVIGAILLLAPLTSASVAQEEQAGSRVLGELESGKLRCAEASGSDFDHIGEYVMERMFGSPRAHEAMNLWPWPWRGLGCGAVAGTPSRF